MHESIEKSLRQKILAEGGSELGSFFLKQYQELKNESYERGKKDLENFTGIPVSHSTLHRLVSNNSLNCLHLNKVSKKLH
jgi:hypothetical protein